jgi:hypothetical protein
MEHAEPLLGFLLVHPPALKASSADIHTEPEKVESFSIISQKPRKKLIPSRLCILLVMVCLICEGSRGRPQEQQEWTQNTTLPGLR